MPTTTPSRQRPQAAPTPPPAAPNGRPTLDIYEPPEGAVAHPNILLYGPPKIGKSTAAASAPPRILFANCETPNALFNARALHGDGIDEYHPTGLQSLIDLTNNLRAGLAAGDLPWSTFVCDPMSDLYRILLRDLSNDATHVSLPVHNDAQTHIERFCRALCELPITTVWVAHEVSQKNDVAGHFESLPMMGTNNPNPAARLMAMVDVIGYCGVAVRDGQAPEYQAQLIPANGRRGGDRYNCLGKLRKLDLSEWLQQITEAKQSTTQSTEGSSK